MALQEFRELKVSHESPLGMSQLKSRRGSLYHSNKTTGPKLINSSVRQYSFYECHKFSCSIRAYISYIRFRVFL